MLTHDQCDDLFSRAAKYCVADELEILIFGGRSALTRFANNTIHQNIAEENYVISVRTSFDGRAARATTNKTDDDSLKRVVKASESMAKVQHPDPDLLVVAPPSMAPPMGSGPRRHFDETSAVTPEQRADGVQKMVAVAKRHNLTAAGIFSTSESIEAVYNSRGLAVAHTQTNSEVSVTMLGGNS